jgi:hypothetical protein
VISSRRRRKARTAKPAHGCVHEKVSDVGFDF